MNENWNRVDAKLFFKEIANINLKADYHFLDELMKVFVPDRKLVAPNVYSRVQIMSQYT